MLSTPVVTLNVPSFWSLTVCVSNTNSPRVSVDVGTRWSTTFTTPPIAPLPKNRVAGPRSTSICLAVEASLATAWSGPTRETSLTSKPF